MKRTIDFVVNEQEELQLMLLSKIIDRPPSFIFDSTDFFLEQFKNSASWDAEMTSILTNLHERIQKDLLPLEVAEYFSDYEYSYGKAKYDELQKVSFAQFLSDLFNKRVYLRLRKSDDDTQQKNIILDMLYEEEFMPVKEWLNDEISHVKVRRSDANRFQRTRDLTYQGWADIYKNQIDGLEENYGRIFSQQISQGEFLKFFGQNRDNLRRCHFCDLSEKNILDLKKAGEIYTKASFANVSKLNIRLRDSSQDCAIGNLIICCHWCERLNIDEFSEAEYREVALVLSKIWENRLKNHPN